MKKSVINFYSIVMGCLILFSILGMPKGSHSQNVGIGASTPQAKLHVKGSADTTQLIIEANGVQNNTRPLIRLRKSDGSDLMWIHSDNSTNSFMGLSAGRVNNAAGGGLYNSFYGAGAGYTNTTGHSNTAIGLGAFYNNTSGYSNTATGVNSLFNNTIGYNNSAYGRDALYFNSNGYDNTATGVGSLTGNTFGYRNTANGTFSLTSNTSGYNNTAIGHSSLYANISGVSNTALGNGTLRSNTSGDDNTAIGNNSLYANTIGFSNTAIGNSSLMVNTTGIYNTATGNTSLRQNTTGDYNTAYGTGSLDENTIGSWNTAIGVGSLNGNTTGFYNTAVGFNAFSTGINFSNSTALGNNAVITASNQTRIGDFNVTSIGGFAGWSNISDVRVKKEINDSRADGNYSVPGLDFIVKLRPVTYYLDMNAIASFLKTPDSLRHKDYEAVKGSILQTGFIAQEVENAALSLGYDFSGVDKPKNENDFYGLRYAEFVVPLVKAVQELKKEIDMLKEQNKTLLQLVNRKN